MRAASFTETRTRVGITVTPAEHFFFDGQGIIPGQMGKGNYARSLSGAMHGTVKVTVMTNGRISLRSIGKAGDGRLVHTSPSTVVVIDGQTFTLDALVRQTVADERREKMIDEILDAIFG